MKDVANELVTLITSKLEESEALEKEIHELLLGGTNNEEKEPEMNNEDKDCKEYPVVDESYESQFKGGPLARAMGESYQSTKTFYREYPTSDYGFIYCRVNLDKDWGPRAVVISEEMANAMIKASPWLELMPKLYYHPRRGLMNKGAIRITPLDATTTELWVYNHDGSYFLLTPPEEENND